MNQQEFIEQSQAIEAEIAPLVKELDEIQNQIDNLRFKQNKLRQEYLEEISLPVGTKVNYEGQNYLVFSVKLVGAIDNSYPNYSLTKPKKDGSLPLKMIDGKHWIYDYKRTLKEGWI